MLLYSSCIYIVTDGHPPKWDKPHSQWINEYNLPVYGLPITAIQRHRSKLEALILCDGTQVSVEAMFTTRGDIYYNELARGLGAAVDVQGEIIVGAGMRTSVKGLYAAGCVTPANCQMIIAAGQGATAAQAINRDLFEASLASHHLGRVRARQLRTRKNAPADKTA